MEIKIVGDKKIFAIESRPNSSYKSEILAHRRIWLNGNPIINEEEVSYLSTFNSFLKDLEEKLCGIELWNHRFEDKTDFQIYTMIINSKNYIDELEDWTNNTVNKVIGGYDDQEYFKYFFNIDETTDQYSIFVIRKNEDVKFLWNYCDENNCMSNDFNRFKSATVHLDEIMGVYQM